MSITDDQVEAVLDSWYHRPLDIDEENADLKSMRAALEVAFNTVPADPAYLTQRGAASITATQIEVGVKVFDEIARERERQIEVEGWTHEHDDKHSESELAWAAACYAQQAGMGDRKNQDPLFPVEWPWGIKFWKPTTPRRDLIKAAALIVAEIERLDRCGVKHDRP